MKNLNYSEYKHSLGFLAVLTKAEFIHSRVSSNLSPLRKNSRSINGGNVGNRHALKRGFRMWDNSGNVISSGTTPLKTEEYSPDL